MTAIVIASRTPGLGGQVSKAAGAITASAAHTALEFAKCKFVAEIDWTACDVSSADELYIVTIEANTHAATTTWTVIGYLLAIGATASVASSGDATATGQVRAAFDNPYDYQVRAHSYLAGTTPSITSAINFYPPGSLDITG